MSVYVIVDDSDPNLQYVPVVSRGGTDDPTEVPENGWYIGVIGVPTEFLDTRSRSFKLSSTASYEFSGSSISVFGTIWAPASCPVACIGTILSFSIDGSVMGTINTSNNSTAQRHVPFFVSPGGLSADSIHNLTVEVLTPASAANSSNYWIDYLIYEAVVNSSIPTSTAQTSWIFVDDRSPYLEYGDGQWSQNIPGFTSDLVDVAFNSSVSGPIATESTVSLNFTGASTIKVYALLTGSNASVTIGTFTIDDEPPQAISVQSPATTLVSNVEILSRSVTPHTSHSIVLKSAAAHSFYLDYILLESPSAFIASSIPTSSNESGGDTVASSTSTESGASHMKVGEIAGGVVGGVVASITMVVVAILFLRHRKTRRSRSGIQSYDAVSEDEFATIGTGSRRHDHGELDQLSTTILDIRPQTPPRSDYTFTATPFQPLNTISTSHNKHLLVGARTPSRVQSVTPAGILIANPPEIEHSSRIGDSDTRRIQLGEIEGTTSSPPPYF